MASRNQGDGLPERTRRMLTELGRRKALTYGDLDVILRTLDPDEYDEQLEILVRKLRSVDLVGSSIPGSSSARSSTPPAAGRISRAYLKEVQAFPAMTREEEVAASRLLEFAARRLQEAEFEDRDLRSARLAEYLCIRAEFVERNLHLVASEVYAYRTYPVSLDDLIQEGNAALIRAVEKFDWRHGVRFRTYVTWWIRQAVERYLAAQKGAVRVPHHLQQKLRRLKREGKLPRRSENELSVDQVAGAFEVSHDSASHLLEASRTSFSLDEPIDDQETSYRDFLVEEWEPRESNLDHKLRGRLHGLLRDLDEREQTVLRMRFGLDGRRARTLEEVGRALRLSRERSRQIQQRALGKLRRRARHSRLSDYL